MVTDHVAKPSAADVDDQVPVQKLLVSVMVTVSVVAAFEVFLYETVKLQVDGTVISPDESWNSTVKLAEFPNSMLNGPD